MIRYAIETLKTLFILALVLVGATFAFGQGVWSPPAGSPSGNNTRSVVNTGEKKQTVQNGAVSVVGRFTTAGDTYLGAQSNEAVVMFGGVGSDIPTRLNGEASVEGSASFAGGLQVGYAGGVFSGMSLPNALEVKGKTFVSQGVYVDNLENNKATIEEAPLCATQEGTIILCEQIPEVPEFAVYLYREEPDSGLADIEHPEMCRYDLVRFDVAPEYGSGDYTIDWEACAHPDNITPYMNSSAGTIPDAGTLCKDLNYPSSAVAEYQDGGQRIGIKWPRLGFSPVESERFPVEVRVTVTDNVTGDEIIKSEEFSIDAMPQYGYAGEVCSQ